MVTLPPELSPRSSPPTSRPGSRSRWRKRTPGHRPRRLLRSLVLVGLVVAAAVLAVAVLWPLTPSVADAEHRVAARLAAHGARDPHSVPVPDKVGLGIIATEDSRFYSHHGLDVLGVVRAMFGFAHGSSDPGGATLDQQLAKNLYTPGDAGIAPKVEQVELAFKLEAHFTKQQILEMYLSAVYFGHGFYGLPAAARGYFGVAPNALTWSQASLLAGLVQAPSAYDPYAHPARARRRQRHVLDRLVATRVLSRAQADSAYAERWGLR